MSAGHLNKLEREYITKCAETIEKLMAQIFMRYGDIALYSKPVANSVLNNVIKRFQKPLDIQVELNELEDNWNVGMIDFKDYYPQKAKLEKELAKYHI